MENAGSAQRAESPEKRREHGRWPAWLPPLVWAALILAASSVQDLQTRMGGIEVRDKLAHFGEYFVFGWLVARCFDQSGWRARKHFAWTLGIGLLLAIVDELYQGFVPGRERDILDILADAVGLLAGWYYSREDEAIGNSHRAPGHS